METEDISTDPDQLLDTAQAASLLRLHPFTLHKWRNVGRRELPWFVVSGRIRYRRAELVEYVERSKFGKGNTPARWQKEAEPPPPSPSMEKGKRRSRMLLKVLYSRR